MNTHPLVFLVALLVLLPAPRVHAQPASVDPHLARVERAIEAAETGKTDTMAYAAALAGHPLYGWIEYAALRRGIDSLPIASGEAFLQRYRGKAVADAFRAIWLPALSRRQEWAAFNAAWSPTIKSSSLRCMSLNARARAGGTDAQWVSDAQALWRSTGKALPNDCDGPFELLAEKGGLTPVLRWERFDKAVDEWNVAVMRAAAKGLPDAEHKLAEDYAAFIATPHDRALSWPKTDRSRRVASQGLAKLGKANPDAAESQLPKFARALAFTEADRGRVLYQVALWTVASYNPGSQRRLAAVPAASYDERLHEWQVREALSRSDWPTALAAIRAMGPEQRSDSRWTYFEGRLLGLTGDQAGAQAAYRRAAQIPEFHGFLAADRLNEPYALCPWLPQADAAATRTVASDPAIVRAMQLFRIGRKGWAEAEWDNALSRFDDAQRRIAVGVAQDNGWFDRAVFALGRTPDERRLYTLRFPLHHDATIRREAARHGIDPAWVAAEIRAESVFDPNARSGANARGLMQVVPATGAAEARRLGLPWHGADSLYDADTNIALGTAYLRKVLDRFGGKPYFAIAGYNAGPSPLQRWQSERPGMDADFWIETISYKETREYVARVLAFSTIYDWRLDGKAVPLTARMLGERTDARKSFVCPLVHPGA